MDGEELLSGSAAEVDGWPTLDDVMRRWNEDTLLVNRGIRDSGGVGGGDGRSGGGGGGSGGGGGGSACDVSQSSLANATSPPWSLKVELPTGSSSPSRERRVAYLVLNRPLLMEISGAASNWCRTALLDAIRAPSSALWCPDRTECELLDLRLFRSNFALRRLKNPGDLPPLPLWLGDAVADWVVDGKLVEKLASRMCFRFLISGGVRKAGSFDLRDGDGGARVARGDPVVVAVVVDVASAAIAVDGTGCSIVRSSSQGGNEDNSTAD